MDTFTINATYENGVLKLEQPLPLMEHQRVQVAVHPLLRGEPAIDVAMDAVRRTSGMLGWTGDAETVERVALDPEFGIQESP